MTSASQTIARLAEPDSGDTQGEAAASRSCQGSLDGTALAPGSASRVALLELARAGASKSFLEAEGYSWFEITAARAEIARERPRCG